MARTDNLTNFLTDVSTAIKTKKGDDTPILASEFDTEIENLPSGSGEDVSNYFATSSAKTASSNNLNIFLKAVPDIDTSKITDFSDFYRSGLNLKTVPTIDTSSGTNFSYMFANCNALKRIPEMDTSKGTNFSCMFLANVGMGGTGTNVLEYIPELDMSSATTISSMFTIAGGNSYKNTTLVDFAGLKDLGKAYLPTAMEKYSSYKLDMSKYEALSEQSLINILTKLYDIASLGVKTQEVVLGETNLAKLTSEAGVQALADAQTKGWTVS